MTKIKLEDTKYGLSLYIYINEDGFWKMIAHNDLRGKFITVDVTRLDSETTSDREIIVMTTDDRTVQFYWANDVSIEYYDGNINNINAENAPEDWTEIYSRREAR